MNMKIGPVLSAAAIIMSGSLLGAKEYDNILLYKDCGTWQYRGGKVISEGADAGRITWDGNVLRFTPRGGSFDLKDMAFFGFAMRVPPEMTNQPFVVKFLYEEGEPVVWKLHTPSHTGWRSANVKLQSDEAPKIRPGKLKSVAFLTSPRIPGFQAVLDDIRFVPDGLDFQLHDEWVPPVTNGCVFPEYTLEQQQKETLNDPEFQAKMAEIERLRQTKLKMSLKPEVAPKENVLRELSRIQPDGSIEGLDYQEAARVNKQRRDWHSINETYMREHWAYFHKLLGYWESGHIPRTEENRRKIFRSLIHMLTAESNRRKESLRFVVPTFLLPGTACRAYRIFFDEMDAVEKGTNSDPDAILLNRLLKEASTWCYFHTFSNTVGPILTVESFRGDSGWTGGNFGYRPTFAAALICRNPKMLEVISEVAKRSLSVTSYNTMNEAFWLDGMTADGSAWGHKNQNYPFGYPLSGFATIGQLIGDLNGTRWAVQADGPAIDTICNYMEALLWHGTGWGKNSNSQFKTRHILQRDIPTACGRYGQLYYEGKGYGDFGKVFQTAGYFLEQLPEGSKQRERLRFCLDVMSGEVRTLPEGTRYFWNNDLLICREKESLAAVTMLSSRVLSIECAPAFSHMTDFWSDGAAWIMKHYDSYRIARGFLKPCATPGVTSRQWEFTHTGTKWRTYKGLHNFAGGATDGSYAVCGYKMERAVHPANPDPNFYDLYAEKSYFWLNGKLLCIGTSISDKSHCGVPVATTIDQTLWRGPAVIAPDATRDPGEGFQAETQFLWHDGVGYAVLNGKGKLSGETREGRWLEIDRNNAKAKKLPKTAPILMFQIDHGANVENGSYAYLVDFHSPDFAALKKMAEDPSFEIAAATPDVHAVREKNSGTLAAVFFQPGEAGGLSVDVPAVALVRQTPDGKVLVTVNDPEQDPKRDSVTLGWNGKSYRIQLPSGVYCGQPVTVDLSALKPLDGESAAKGTAAAP